MTTETAALADVRTLRQPNENLIAELEQLLEAARSGELRGVLFVGYAQGSDNYRFGLAGGYSLAEFAMGLKLMELEFDSIVTSMGERDE